MPCPPMFASLHLTTHDYLIPFVWSPTLPFLPSCPSSSFLLSIQYCLSHSLLHQQCLIYIILLFFISLILRDQGTRLILKYPFNSRNKKFPLVPAFYAKRNAAEIHGSPFLMAQFLGQKSVRNLGTAFI